MGDLIESYLELVEGSLRAQTVKYRLCNGRAIRSC